MTRYTSLAYKRTHYDAGFDNDAPAEPAAAAAAPAKKKQKIEKAKKDAPKKGWGRDPSIKDQAAKSEQRRQKRADERQSNTVCFACRGRGHAAKDCPDSNLLEGEEKAKPAMGICYRCGATNHSLKRCRRPENPDDPLPFATCFVCGGKGHLAGGCAKNARGVYPDGGSCVLCGKTTHLARDCELRKQAVVDHAIMAAEPKKALNPDEDDFHAFKRKQLRVEKALKAEEKLTKRAPNANSNASAAPQARPPKPKAKVVSF